MLKIWICDTTKRIGVNKWYEIHKICARNCKFANRLFSPCNRFWRNTSVISAEVNTWWTKLQGKRSPPTYTLDKFWAQKGIFCTVFPCQICTGLHKIYSYALLTEREVKMAIYWPSSFFFFAFLWTETKSRSIKK